MNTKDQTKDRFSMIHGDVGVSKLIVKLIPHSMLPEAVRDVLVKSMFRRDGGLEAFPRGCFWQHEVGGNVREGMLEEFKVYEDWLETIGVEKGETALQEWDW